MRALTEVVAIAHANGCITDEFEIVCTAGNVWQKKRAFLALKVLKPINSSQLRYIHSNLPKLSSPTTDQNAQDTPRSKAMKLLDWFPGDTLAKKTGYVTLGTGLASFLIVNNIYVVNEETLILASFIAFVRFAYKNLSKPVAEYLDGSINDIRYKLIQSQESGKNALRETIKELESFRDYEDVTKEFMDVKRENVFLESQLHELKQVNKEYSIVKALLEERNRFEIEKRDQEKRSLVSSIIEGVLADLKDPKMQDTILNQCLLDIEQLQMIEAK